MSLLDSRGHGNFSTLKNWVRNPVPGQQKSYDYYLKNNLNNTKGRKTRNVNGNGKAESTHFLLRGGVWDIPANDNDQFLWHYAVSLFQNDELTVVEKRTNHFRYHLDFDFADVHAISLNDFRAYVAVVQEVLRIFYPHSPNVCFECTISKAENKEVPAKVLGAPNLIKTGFHVIFHNIWVDADKALAIRAYLITKIRSHFGTRDTNVVNDWEDIVDETIYIKNGLRMIGSQKYHACKCNARSNSKKKVVPMYPFIKEKSNNNVNLEQTDASAGQPPVAEICDKCQNTGYIFEGRPYFVVAAWDHKCETITRKVKVSKRITPETPCYQRAPSDYVRPEWYFPFPSTKMSEEKPGNFYWAMPAPDFGPVVEKNKKTFEPNFNNDDMDLGSDDDLLDYRQLGSMKRASDMEKFNSFSGLKESKETETDEYVFIPFCDLIVFGDPRLAEIETQHRNNPWHLVRLFHNTLRLVSLRMNPLQECELEALEGKIRADEKHGKTYSPDNYEPSPFPIFSKPALSVPFARYDAVIERMTKENDKPLKSRPKRRVEGINEFQAIQRGGKEKVFLTDEALLDEIQLFIRENVGVRMEEPKQPYGQIDVVGVYHNLCAQKKPTAYMVQVRGIGASFCFNKNGDHNSNGIYFKIDSKNGIAQRCFCTCADTHGRVTGKPCKDFQGKSYPLPKKLKQILFPKNKAATSETMFQQERKLVTDPVAMEMIIRSAEKPTFSSDLGNPEELQKGFEEFLKKKRAREEGLGFEDPSKRIKG